ncbi:MAG: hypothetical protein LIO79_08150 [Rikenellaceae bacterium]|nr:hypothetical protein [Rikenellaceae bacterium]
MKKRRNNIRIGNSLTASAGDGSLSHSLLSANIVTAERELSLLKFPEAHPIFFKCHVAKVKYERSAPSVTVAKANLTYLLFRLWLIATNKK